MHVEVRELPSIPLAVVRRRVHAADLARVVPESCGFVWKALRAQRVQAGRHIAVYWNAEIQLEVGVELLGPFAEDETVVRSSTPGGLTAYTTHLGPYGQLEKAHEAVRQWCAIHGHRLAGPNWEVYGHWLPEWSESPMLIRTDVFYQVATG